MYYKANKKVAEYLQLTAERNETRDGNYILWVADINRFGSLANIGEILANIGAVAIHPKDVRDELLGVTNTPLPKPLDKKFVIEAAGSVPEEESQTDVTESTSESETTNSEEE